MEKRGLQRSLRAMIDRMKRNLLMLKVILAALSLLCARRSCGGAQGTHGPDETGGARGAAAQPQKYQRGDSAQHPYGHYRTFGFRQIVAGLRHHLCGRAAPLRGVAIRLCAAVSRSDGTS